MIRIFLFLIISLFLSCTNDVEQVNALFSEIDSDKEIAHDVEIFYSDSAYVRIKIEAPKMIRYLEKSNQYEEFPEGLKVSFFNENGSTSSWLTAGYARRQESEKKIYVKDDVLVYNNRNDKMRAIELVWDETTEEIYTEKAVKIMQPSVGDTLFGYGVLANQDFTRFEIKKRVSAIKRFEN